MKKILCLLISGYLLAGGIFIYPAVGDCRAGEKDPVRIVVTCYPEYDWVMNVLGDNPAGAEVILLVDNGVDIHSYQPSAEDILMMPVLAMRDTVIRFNDRICQCRLLSHQPEIEWRETDRLDGEKRGGFGSSGTK